MLLCIFLMFIITPQVLAEDTNLSLEQKLLKFNLDNMKSEDATQLYDTAYDFVLNGKNVSNEVPDELLKKIENNPDIMDKFKNDVLTAKDTGIQEVNLNENGDKITRYNNGVFHVERNENNYPTADELNSTENTSNPQREFGREYTNVYTFEVWGLWKAAEYTLTTYWEEALIETLLINNVTSKIQTIVPAFGGQSSDEIVENWSDSVHSSGNFKFSDPAGSVEDNLHTTIEMDPIGLAIGSVFPYIITDWIE